MPKPWNLSRFQEALGQQPHLSLLREIFDRMVAVLGLRFEDLDGLSPEQQLKLLAEAISRIEDPTRRAGIAMTL